MIVLVGLAVARATRLLRDDKVLDRPRGWALSHLAAPGRQPWARNWLFTLIQCAWCISGWLSLAAAVAMDYYGSLPLPFLSWFAIWWIACAGYWALELVFETHEKIWE